MEHQEPLIEEEQEPVENGQLACMKGELDDAFKERSSWTSGRYVPENASIKVSKGTYVAFTKHLQELATVRADLRQCQSQLRASEKRVEELEFDKTIANAQLANYVFERSNDPTVKKLLGIKQNNKIGTLAQQIRDQRGEIDVLETKCAAQASQLDERADQTIEMDKSRREIEERDAKIDQMSLEITKHKEEIKELADQVSEHEQAEKDVINAVKKRKHPSQ